MPARPVPRDEDTALLLFIATYTEQHGFPPSYREIADVRGIAYSTVNFRIQRLAKVGRLNLTAETSRTLRVVPA